MVGAVLLALCATPAGSTLPLPVVNMGTPPAPAGVAHCCGGGGRAVNASCCDATERAAVIAWLASGGVGLESSLAYGTSVGLGQGFRASGRDRSSVFVTTKVGCSPTRAEVAASIDKGLAQLQMEYVDLLTMCAPPQQQPPRRTRQPLHHSSQPAGRSAHPVSDACGRPALTRIVRPADTIRKRAAWSAAASRRPGRPSRRR